MTVNIIHLEERKDRMQMLEKELMAQAITDYKIWEGIKDPVIANGIARAHKQIISEAKEKRLSNVLIAEDDIHFTAAGAFKFYLEQIPAFFDIYFGGVTWGKYKRNGLLEDFSGMTLYMVNERFYDNFLALPEGRDIDRTLQNRGEYVVCNPMVVIQHNGFSDHYQRVMDLNIYFSNAPLYGKTNF